MLTIYDADKPIKGDIIRDVVAEFDDDVDLSEVDSEYLNKVLYYIDQCSIDGSGNIIDRFGHKIYRENLSTGCKAAILVGAKPDKIVDLVECGLNARDVIINFSKTGSIKMYDVGNSLSILDVIEGQDIIDVKFDNNKFNSLNELNKYIDSYWGW